MVSAGARADARSAVVPLTLLTLDASGFIQLGKRHRLATGADMVSKQKWSIYFLNAVGVWNFVGAESSDS
jgi:nitric oxide reductase subunit B